MTLEVLWYWLLAFMVATYVVLDGFDLGVGILHPFVARTPGEREASIRSVGPVWDGNEVWLVAAGGTMVMAFPTLLATAFSGFYLPLMIVLWLLVARALAIELRHHVEDPLWHQLCDAGFFASSLTLAVVIGAALGNVFRGVSMGEDGTFFAPLWTDFRVGDDVGILDWFTILVGVTAASALAHHGALWLGLKTEGSVRVRAGRVAGPAMGATLGLTVLVIATGAVVRSGMHEVAAREVGAACLSAASLVALVASGVLRARGRDGAAFGASCVYLYATIGAGASLLFPDVLPARDPSLSLSIEAAAAPDSSLRIALWWWVPGMVLVGVYTWIVYRSTPRRIGAGGDEL